MSTDGQRATGDPSTSSTIINRTLSQEAELDRLSKTESSRSHQHSSDDQA